MVFSNHSEENEFKSRLDELFGLEAIDIQDIIMAGVISRRDCTENHPKIYAGLNQWANTVRALRDKTAPKDWFKSQDNNFELAVHPNNNVAIAVQTGDKNTGLSEEIIPSNRAPKGPSTQKAVWENHKQLSLFDVSDLPEVTTIESNINRMTWILLYYKTSKEIRFELSLPLEISGGKIFSWQERLIFSPLVFDQIDFRNDDDNDGQTFDINVERKN